MHFESRGDDRLRWSRLDEVLSDAQWYKPGRFALVGGDFNLDASGSAADALNRANLEDAWVSCYMPTKPHSFLEQGKIIGWIFVRKTMRTVY